MIKLAKNSLHKKTMIKFGALLRNGALIAKIHKKSIISKRNWAKK